MSERRKLAAILAADVVGYSRLAGADEERTLARLRALWGDLLDPAVAAHHGRVVKRTGDGALVEFRSVVDAVRCAIEIQNGMAERNAGVQKDRKIEFRIGIHLGDVVEEADGDLMGDGVNIAARLEGIAQPGAICLSEDAYRQVRSRIEFEAADLGEQRLKNIAHPVRAYALHVGLRAPPRPPAPKQRRSPRATILAVALLVIVVGVAWYFLARPEPAIAPFANVPAPSAVAQAPAAPASTTNAPTTTASAPIPQASPPSTAPPADARKQLSIVVLPFHNLGGDPKQDYLADVLTDALTTYISHIPGSFVIARNTAFTFKGKSLDVKQIGKDLGVRYLLEGSIQPTDKRIRTNTQLIDTETGAHLWAEQFDNDKADLPQTEDEIVTRLARTLQVQLAGIAAASLAREHPANPDAQELALRCQAAYFNFGPLGPQAEAGFTQCEKALSLDPKNVVALTTLTGQLFARVFGQQSADRAADLKRADELTERALAIEPDNAAAIVAKGLGLLAANQFNAAQVEFDRALALNPSEMNAYAGLCSADLFAGQTDEVVACVDKAVRLSPRDMRRSLWLDLAGDAYLVQGRDKEALAAFRRAVAADENFLPAVEDLIAALALTGNDFEAHELLHRYLALRQTKSKTIADFRKHENSNNPVYRAMHERVYEGLAKAGIPEK